MPNRAAGTFSTAVDPATSLPDGAVPLAPQVAAPPALTRRLLAVGVVARADGPRLQALLAPGQRLVSREGDLWRWDGLAVAAGSAASATALHLQQKNRLADLRRAEAAATTELEAARAARAAASARQSTAAATEAAARAARRSAEQAAAEAARALARAETAEEALDARTASLRAAGARRADELAAARIAEAEAERAASALADPAEARTAVDAERLRVEAARITMLTRRAEADELDRAGAARLRRLAEIDRETESWHARGASAGSRLSDLDRRAAETAAAWRRRAAARRRSTPAVPSSPRPCPMPSPAAAAPPTRWRRPKPSFVAATPPPEPPNAPPARPARPAPAPRRWPKPPRSAPRLPPSVCTPTPARRRRPACRAGHDARGRSRRSRARRRGRATAPRPRRPRRGQPAGRGGCGGHPRGSRRPWRASATT